MRHVESETGGTLLGNIDGRSKFCGAELNYLEGHVFRIRVYFSRHGCIKEIEFTSISRNGAYSQIYIVQFKEHLIFDEFARRKNQLYPKYVGGNL